MYYPTITLGDARSGIGAPPAFKDFVIENKTLLAPILDQRLVQTHEVRRAAVLYFSLSWLADRYPLERAALVEIGSATGLFPAIKCPARSAPTSKSR